jgi:hypothetical protein|tara:strand:+ start:339 stop:671 length:333 start_codon:yes stop_codon:yes gene_type:complete
MIIFLAKILVSVSVIVFCSWISGKHPVLAGFIVALPLTSMLVLLFSQLEWQDSANTINFAKSILFALPVTVAFFLPFLFADKFGLSFWHSYFLGFLLLIVGYFVHSKVMG